MPATGPNSAEEGPRQASGGVYPRRLSSPPARLATLTTLLPADWPRRQQKSLRSSLRSPAVLEFSNPALSPRLPLIRRPVVLVQRRECIGRVPAVRQVARVE